MTTDPYDPVALGDSEPGEDVHLLLKDGAAVLVPASVARLSGPAYDAVAEVQRLALFIQEAQTQLSEAVAAARAFGVSWGAVGWSVGTSSEAARQRWGTPPRESR